MNNNWFKGKQNRMLILLGLILALIFICSIDFWNWNSSSLGFLGFPIWIWYVMILTLLLSIVYYLIIAYYWRNNTL